MTQAPVRTTTPTIAPDEEPGRRLHPDEVCPDQKSRVVREITRVI